MIFYPNAKINLGLQVTGKRADGFHNIDSVFYPVMWRDILEIIPMADPKTIKSTFSYSGISVPGNADDNLCVKAYHLLKQEYNLPEIQLHLHKIIPMGAGLGGGSADGAFALKSLNEIFQLNISEDKLISFAGMLGSDCMFFIKNKPAYITGRGDVMEEIDIDLSAYKIIIVHPGLHISTADAYSKMEFLSQNRTTKEIVLNEPVENWKNILRNDFEKIAFEKFPVIREIKEKLYKHGAIYASMSGSGSAVYGIFTKSNDESFINIFEKHNHKIIHPSLY